MFAGGAQLLAGSFGERAGLHRLEHGQGRAELVAGFAASLAPPEPLPVEQVGPGQVGVGAGRLQVADRLLVERLRPARHGPPLSRPVAGDVVGFALRWPGQPHGVLWISGDTVLYDGVRQVAERLTVDTAVLHLGAVRFGITGPVRYTMTAREAVDLCALLRPRTVLPVHYEGWGHFREGRQAIEDAFAAAPEEVGSTLRWLPPGRAVTL